MRGVRLIKCIECKFYTIEGISERCTREDNQYTNWLGLMYKKHPAELNLRENCKSYEEIDT